MKNFKRFWVLFVAFLALFVAMIGTVGVASAHTSQPATRCTIAFVTWQSNPTPGNAAAAAACIQTHTVGASGNPFNFNVANFGFQNGFGFNPAFGFNPGFGGFIPFDGFGASVNQCPANSHAVEDPASPVSAPTWSCVVGLGGLRGPTGCPPNEQLIEVGYAGAPTWICQP